jgi:hypothetical protein
MDTLTITKSQLHAVLLRWEQDARDGKTLTHEETDALPLEQVVAESADHLWTLLTLQPQTVEEIIARDLRKPMQEAIFPVAKMITGDGRST